MAARSELGERGMRVLVLGCGLQGRAVVHDLVQSPSVGQVTCADANVDQTRAVLEKLGSDKTVAREFDAGDPEALAALMGRLRALFALNLEQFTPAD